MIKFIFRKSAILLDHLAQEITWIEADRRRPWVILRITDTTNAGTNFRGRWPCRLRERGAFVISLPLLLQIGS